MKFSNKNQTKNWAIKGYSRSLDESLVPRYESLVPRYESLVPRYESLVPKYESLVPKYESLVPKYESLVGNSAHQNNTDHL